jgi:hypothetical protein
VVWEGGGREAPPYPDYVSREMEKIQSHRELDIYFQNVDHTDIKTIEGEVSLS